uniref:WLM domain-containing protein n=1 Tax=viral metagenome TaxID=1070528 RepID=A0A6C0B507_9ZZZZ
MKFAPHVVVIVIAMLGYLLYQYVNGGPGNLVSLKAEKDGRAYLVQDLPNKKEAVEMLATIKGNMDKVAAFYGQEEFVSDPTAKNLVERYNPHSIMENSMTSHDTSYSENKGEKIVICLRDKTNPPGYPLVDLNTVMFVVLHEMAHLMTTELSTGKHTPEFWANFRRLLQDATQIGVYHPVNYAHSPVSYCGMEITDSPL